METREENIRIWADTIHQCLYGKYKNCPASKSFLCTNLSLVPNRKYLTTINVINVDTLTCCQILSDQGLNVLGLNMAAPGHPGGGVGRGCFAQEENCFRRSNYFLALPKIPELYPIPENGCIYTKTITVIKDQKYQLLEKPFTVSMVACAALRHPPMKSNGEYLKDSDQQLMKDKIDQIFQTGLLNQHDCLVLSAFGCGAFGNNPTIVAELFNEAIKKYWGCFKNITFAVLSYKDNNYAVFKQKIQTIY